MVYFLSFIRIIFSKISLMLPCYLVCIYPSSILFPLIDFTPNSQLIFNFQTEWEIDFALFSLEIKHSSSLFSCHCLCFFFIYVAENLSPSFRFSFPLLKKHSPSHSQLLESAFFLSSMPSPFCILLFPIYRALKLN